MRTLRLTTGLFILILTMAIGSQAVLAVNPKRAEQYNRRGVALMQKKHYSQALGYFNQAIQLYPGFTTAWINRGHAKLALKRPKGARDDFIQAHKLDRRNPGPLYGLGRAWYMMGKYDLAVRDFTRAIQLYPRYTQAYFGRSHARWRLGQPRRAYSDAQQVVRLAPKYRQGHEWLRFLRGKLRQRGLL